MTIITTMCKLLLAMIIGFYFGRKGILNAKTNANLSTVIVQITCPALIISSVTTVSHDNPQMVLKLFLAGIIVYAILPFFARAIVEILRVPAHLKGTFMCMFIFSNNMFMGYPVVQAIFGDSAIFYITIFNFPFNILYFSLGMHFLSKDAAIGAGEFKKEPFSLRKFMNNGIIAAIIALIIYFANIPIPGIVTECLNFVGGITTPLSMIIIGASIASASLKEIKGEKAVWPMLPIRLIVIPVLVWLFMHLFTNDPTLLGIVTVGAGMPVASLVAMGAAPYPRQSKAASIGVAVSTICSLVTIPVMIVILSHAG